MELSDKYELLGPIGKGGFGEVHKARQAATGQLVAVKILRLHPQGPSEDAQIARFRREMQLCGSLHHPNIVRLIDSGKSADDIFFTVFEFVPGCDLAAVLGKESTLELDEALHLMSQVLDALACAHEQGIVHRDLKPSNIMLSPGARRNATVLDFGIGALVDEARREEVGRLTGSHEMLGTPAYAAPEQLRGQPPSANSDLYAWGLVLLECLTGERVMKGRNLMELVTRQVSEDPIVIPVGIAKHPIGAILRRVLIKDPRQRQVTAAGLLRDLQADACKRPLEMFSDETVTGMSSVPEPTIFAAHETHPASSGEIRLPAQPTKFLGREAEIEAATEILRHDDVRLLTLTGPGGTGKTRLSIRVAETCANMFPGGVAFVPLATITDPTLIPQAIATTLDLQEAAGRTLLDTVQGYLTGRRFLLVLDNFEQLVTSAHIVSDLLDACRELKILVSSRERLDLRFEREFPVPALSIPSELQEPEGLEQLTAVQLFVARVKDFRPGFEPSRDMIGLIAEVCRQLDGLPLAIELAASRLRILSLNQLVVRLDDRLKLLRSGTRDRDSRHQTLRSTIDWSYKLLKPEEQALFRQVAVFQGGFEFDAAEAICEVEFDVIEGLSSLVNKSLLRRIEVDFEPRLSMLQTIREYALELIERELEFEILRERHARYYASLVARAAPELCGRHQAPWVAALVRETDNLRAMRAWSFEVDDSNMIVETYDGLCWFWNSQGRFNEGRVWTERALAYLPKIELPLLRARLLVQIAYFYIFVGDYVGARPYADEAVSLFREFEQTREIAYALVALGITSAAQGMIPEGPEMLMEAVDLSREHDTKYSHALALIALGEGARLNQLDEHARASYSESLTLLDDIGNIFWRGYVLQNLAHVMLHLGDWEQAVLLLTEARSIGLEYRYAMLINLYLAAMGGVAVARSMFESAAQLFGAVQSQLDEIGASFQPSDAAELARNSAVTRQAFDDEAQFQQCWAQGTRMSIGDALELAAKLTEATCA